jgi:hypothetical protein
MAKPAGSQSQTRQRLSPGNASRQSNKAASMRVRSKCRDGTLLASRCVSQGAKTDHSCPRFLTCVLKVPVRAEVARGDTKKSRSLGFGKGAISPNPLQDLCIERLYSTQDLCPHSEPGEIERLIWDICSESLLRQNRPLHPNCIHVWNHHRYNLALCGALIQGHGLRLDLQPGAAVSAPY